MSFVNFIPWISKVSMTNNYLSLAMRWVLYVSSLCFTWETMMWSCDCKHFASSTSLTTVYKHQAQNMALSANIASFSSFTECFTLCTFLEKWPVKLLKNAFTVKLPWNVLRMHDGTGFSQTEARIWRPVEYRWLKSDVVKSWICRYRSFLSR